jgi:UDP-2-acetamido-2-deoxy-ribo-hexuluronate aminotransferase
MSIPFIDLKSQYVALKPQIQERIERVLEHGQYIMGPEVRELEERLEEYTGAKHCITVASGTEALLISLMALGIGRGDEVITTPFTFVSTAEVIVLLGATPVFVDIEPDTCNINPRLIENKITEKTKAIIPVSLYGQPADLEAIGAIGARNGGIPIIEDAAQSFGADYRGSKSCNLSTIGCTSFFPSKPLGCYGDGGAIFTSDDGIAGACREIRVHGQSERYVHTRVGVGGRMDTLQCAIVLAKMERFEGEILQRRNVARRYHELLAGNEPNLCLLPWPRHECNSVYAQYTLRVMNRKVVQEKLLDAGVPSAIHYPLPINEQPAYSHFCCPDCTPIAQQMAGEVICLPVYADLTEADQQCVVAALTKA